MGKRKKHKAVQEGPVEDPIAKRLHEKFIDYRTRDMAYHVDKMTRMDKYKAIQDQYYAIGQQEPQAQYETYDFTHSDDPEIVELLERLGINPVTTLRATIVVEQGQPVRITTEGLSLNKAEPNIGAEWK
jgi:hypothetical protein